MSHLFLNQYELFIISLDTSLLKHDIPGQVILVVHLIQTGQSCSARIQSYNIACFQPRWI